MRKIFGIILIVMMLLIGASVAMAAYIWGGPPVETQVLEPINFSRVSEDPPDTMYPGETLLLEYHATNSASICYSMNYHVYATYDYGGYGAGATKGSIPAELTIIGNTVKMAPSSAFPDSFSQELAMNGGVIGYISWHIDKDGYGSGDYETYNQTGGQYLEIRPGGEHLVKAEIRLSGWMSAGNIIAWMETIRGEVAKG